MLELDGAAFELFETDEGRWRWRLVDDGTALATSFRAHDDREDARRAMATVREHAPDAPNAPNAPNAPEVTVERSETDADTASEA